MGTLLSLAPAALGSDPQARTGPGKGAAGEVTAADAAAEPTGPLVLYWDEAKEALTPTPIPKAPTIVLSIAERRMLSRSDAGLRQLHSADPAGGVVLDLGGRYQTVFVSLVDSTGKLRIICLDAEPKGGARAK